VAALEKPGQPQLVAAASLLGLGPALFDVIDDADQSPDITDGPLDDD